jgi:predicted DNA-binding transcriptional regulator AlpA
METAREFHNLGGHRTLIVPERERALGEAGARIREGATAPSDEPRTAQGGRLALIPAMMNIAQAAAYIGIAKSTLYTWRTRRPGFGPRAVKAGGALRYRRSDLDAWIEAHAEALDLEPAADVVRDAEPGFPAVSRALDSLSRRSGPRSR